MRNLKSLATMLGVCLFLLSSSIKADMHDNLTKFTFSGPVKVGKVNLPAGTYVFKLADTNDRHVVQILNEDQTKVIATILAIPEWRVEATGKTKVKFSESSGQSGTSGELSENGIPLKEWFYPGANSGQGFKVEPNPQVAEAEPVAAPEPAPEAEAQPAPEAQPEAQAETPEAAPETAAPAPEEPAPQEAPVPAPEAPAPVAAPEELPQTAGQAPLVGLIGVLALVAAASLRIFLKVSA